MDAQGDRWSLHGCLYLTEFSDFVYQQATGEEERGLAVLLYSQADATFIGLDLEGTATVASWENGQLNLNAFYDTVSRGAGHLRQRQPAADSAATRRAGPGPQLGER